MNLTTGNDARENIPFLSIAIASYNYGKYIERAFKAIQGQSFTDYEIVYLDDASTDNSVEVINNIINKYPEMKIKLIINKTNQGIFASKTRLIHECTGQYIMLCDADDWMGEGCLEALVSAVKKDGTDRAVCEVIDIDSEGKCIQIQDLPKRPSRWLWNINHGCIYRRSIFIHNDIKIEHEPDDVNLICEFNKYSDSVSWVHKPLYYWFVHDDSTGRNITEDKSEAQKKNFRDTILYLKKIYVKSDSNMDKCDIELLALKLYYLFLFHTMQNYKLKNKMKEYTEIRNIMRDMFPHYLNMPVLKVSKNRVRKYARCIISVSLMLERVRMFRIAYIAYHVVSRVHHFDQ